MEAAATETTPAPGERPGPARRGPSEGLAKTDRLDWARPGLSRFSRRVLCAATEALLAEHDAATGALAPAPPAVVARGVEGVDRMLGIGSSDLRRGFWVLSVALELLPLFLIGAFARMSRLPLARRIAYLEALETSRVGLLAMLFVAVKVPTCIAAFEDPAMLRLTGFDRADLVVRRKRLGVAAAPQERA